MFLLSKSILSCNRHYLSPSLFASTNRLLSSTVSSSTHSGHKEAAATSSTPFSSSSTAACFRASYERLIASGFKDDYAQRSAVEVLTNVAEDIDAYRSRSALSRLWNSRATVKGAYLNGGVGCGKTLLATSLYDCIPLRKKSFHFHEFMLDIHARIHSKRRGSEHKIRSVALDISSDTDFLYLDEIQITDITDALLIRSLFQHLFAKGTILLLTSNRRPEKLYENGLQYELFQPVVPLLREHCRVYEMDATRDYRMLNSQSEKRTVYVSSAREFDAVWEGLTKGEFPVREDRVPVYGGSRYLVVPMAIREKRICYFTFNQLCDRPLSEADYIALCNRFHTIFLRDIPIIDPINMRNQSRRFRSFIDQAYRCKVKLIMNAPVAINQLFVKHQTGTGTMTEEMFEAERIASRLQEMITDQYLESAWEPSSQNTDD